MTSQNRSTRRSLSRYDPAVGLALRLLIGFGIVLIVVVAWALADQIGTLVGHGLAEWNVR